MTMVFDDLERGRRVEQPISPWIQTYTGVRFDLAAPRAEDVCLADIVHALACLTRFTGHARVPYSIAEHSCRVADLVAREHRKAALLHDATEAYVNDLSAPLKRMGELTGYREVEARVWAAVAARFEIPIRLPTEVKQADLMMLEIERRELLGAPPASWDLGLDEEHVRRARRRTTRGLLGWTWTRAKGAFAEALETAGVR